MHRLPRESVPGDGATAPNSTDPARPTDSSRSRRRSRRQLAPVVLASMAIAARLALGDAARGEPQEGGGPRNVILIVVDDLGAADLSCQGSQIHQTPNIDRLASQGARFTDAYAAAALGSPSSAALLTGRYPARIGITDQIGLRSQGSDDPAVGAPSSGYRRGPGELLEVPNSPLWMERGEITLAEVLRDAGYATGFLGTWQLGGENQGPDGQGFGVNPDPEADEADEAEEFLRAHADQPFFLEVVHDAVGAPPRGPTARPTAPQTHDEASSEQATYAAMIERVDVAVGLMLDTLDRLRIADRTLILFTSDNGGPLPFADNGSLRGGEGSPYEGSVRVPLIARLPGVIPAGVVCKTPVCGIDVLPTVCAALEVEPPHQVVLDGVDFIPLLATAPDAPPRPLFWHFPHYRSSDIGPYSIVRLGDWKLIRFWEGLRHELYHLATDGSESTDVATEHPETVARLTRLLDQHLLSARAPLPRTPIPPGATGYMGRRIAQTMHWEGSEWLLRETREEEEHASRLLALLGIQPGWTVCDLGVGSGYHALPIARMVGPTGCVLGVDIQPEMLFFLEERARQASIENIHPILGELHDPRLPAASCDLVLMVDVYHELSHPEEVLCAVRRALRPGGRLALVEFRAEDPAVPIKTLHKMSKEQMRSELAANGFEVAREHDSLPWQHVMLFAVTER